MNVPGLLRIAGDLDRVDRLVTLFDSPPSYGDGYAVASEDVHTLCGLLKRYLRALPEPLLDARLGVVFWHACVEPAIQVSTAPVSLGMPLSTGPDDRSGSHGDKRRVAIVQCILRLLPTKAFSLLVYVTAFLSQAPLFPDNKLTLESVSSLLGPALLGARPVGGDDEKAGQGLLWLLKNWNEVTDGLLEDRFDVDVEKLRSPTPMPPMAIPGKFPSTDTVGQTLQTSEAPRSYPVVVSDSQQAEVVDDVDPPMATAPLEQPLERTQRASSLSPGSKRGSPSPHSA